KEAQSGAQAPLLLKCSPALHRGMLPPSVPRRSLSDKITPEARWLPAAGPWSSSSRPRLSQPVLQPRRFGQSPPRLRLFLGQRLSNWRELLAKVFRVIRGGSCQSPRSPPHPAPISLLLLR